MTGPQENPFAGFGGIVRGESFIGRKEDLRTIESRVIRPAEPGNLAIVGEPRIGKSSLIYHGIMDRKADLRERRMLPVWLNVATFERAETFFRSLVVETRDAMEELEWMTAPVSKTADRALEDRLSWTEGYGRIQRFFQKVREADVRVVFILDEFDAARHLFRGDLSGFQGLRELAYRPEWRVAFVTASRRSIRTIETQAGSISTLDGIFQKRYLGMFSHEDYGELLARLARAGVPLDDAGKGEVERFCGRHPYLLERLAFSLVEQRQTSGVDIPALQRELNPEFVDHYEKTTSLLKEEGSLARLLQILFGPVLDVTQMDVDDLLKYGWIEVDIESGSYRAFSRHFEEYLRMVARSEDLWPLWARTERELRGVIFEHVVQKYGESWPVKLERGCPRLKPMLETSSHARDKEQASFGARASTNLLDFMYPDDLYQIMRTDWSWFRTVFGKEATEWQPAFQVLARVRTPLAHNRDVALLESDRIKAQGYCHEILERIACWREMQGATPAGTRENDGGAAATGPPAEPA